MKPVYQNDGDEDRGASRRRPPGFAVIPADVLAMRDGYAVAVYAAIARHADNDTGECWPSLSTLCEMTGWTRPTVKRAIKRLVDGGALAVVTRHTDAGGQQTNQYRCVFHGPALVGTVGATTLPPPMPEIGTGGQGGCP